MKNIEACFSRKSDEWATPKAIYDFFVSRGWYDPCPLGCKVDGLEMEWLDHNFVNPPYSDLSRWIDKAISECEKGRTVLLLIPARTDTKIFVKLWDYGAHFFFIRGRLRFNDSKPAPFPSMFVLLDCDTEGDSFCFSYSLADFLKYWVCCYE